MANRRKKNMEPGAERDERDPETYLTAREQEAVLLMLTCSVVETAKRLGVSSSSVYKWSTMPHFQKALEKARKEAFKESMGLLRSASAEAVMCLKGCLKGGKASDRIRAALGILDHAVNAAELTRMTEQIEFLEKELLARGEGNGDQHSANGRDAEEAGDAVPAGGATERRVIPLRDEGEDQERPAAGAKKSRNHA